MLLGRGCQPKQKSTLDIAGDFAKDKKLELKNKFIQTTDLKGVYTRLNHKVDLAVQAYEKEWEDKRNELKVKLLEDETCLTSEYVGLAQKYAENLKEQKKLKADAIEKRREDERLAFVAEMYRKQKIDNCQELRQKLQTERRKLLASAHELQIKEKEQLRHNETELDLMYLHLMNKLDTYDVETCIQRKQLIGRVELEEFLKKQIRANELAKEELETLKAEEIKLRIELDKRMKEEDELELMRTKEKQKALRKTIEEQIKSSKDVRMKKIMWEDQMDRVLIEDLQEEMRQYKESTHENKLKLAEELREFSQVIKEIREYKKAMEDADSERTLRIAEEKQGVVKEITSNVREEKFKLAKNTVTYWDEQLAERGRGRQEIRDVQKAQKDIFDECNTGLDKARLKEVRELNRKVQEDLKEQIKYKKLQEEREKEKECLERKRLEEEDPLRDCVNLDPRANQRLHPFFRAFFPNYQNEQNK